MSDVSVTSREARPPSVLLVDDEISSTEVLALILAGEGLKVTLAADGRQALERLDEAAPSLIITDFMMPGANGAEFVAALRSSARHAHAKVLMISGAAESALRCYGIAYNAFLRKPFSLDVFLATVHELLAVDQVPRGPDL